MWNSVVRVLQVSVCTAEHVWMLYLLIVCARLVGLDHDARLLLPALIQVWQILVYPIVTLSVFLHSNFSVKILIYGWNTSIFPAFQIFLSSLCIELFIRRTYF